MSIDPPAPLTMSERIERFDWAKTPLGAIDGWPQSLKTAVDIMLGSGHAMRVAWGPRRTLLYNDAYAPMLGDRAETALGIPLDEAWPEVWREISPLIDQVFAGETVRHEDMPMTINRHGHPEQTWWSFSYSPIRDEAGSVAGVLSVCAETTDRVRHRAVEESVARSERFARALVEGVPQLVWRAVDGGEWTWASPQWTAFTGQAERDSHGFGWLEQVHPDDRAPTLARWRAAAETGSYEAEYRLHHAAGGDYRWFQTRAAPVRNEAGAVIEWLGTSTDIEDLRSLQERQRTLVAELQHRVRNMLTVLRAVLDRTVDAEGPIEEKLDHFRGRLDSLARIEVMATGSSTGRVDLYAMVLDELLGAGAASSPAVTIDGPDVLVGGEVAETLGLAIHELTTNALKYGALKVRGGKLCIGWHVEPDADGGQRLHLDWREEGVPAISALPVRFGFGRELIEKALPYQLGAETSLAFRGGGIACHLSIPLPAPSAPAGR